MHFRGNAGIASTSSPVAQRSALMAAPTPTQSFEHQFIELQDKLTSYLFRITANRQDAEDLAQETYLKAARSLSQFEQRSSLKTWIFAIATNLARDNKRARHRWQEDIQDRCRVATKAAPEKVETMLRIVDASESTRYEFREHMDYCFTCIAKTLLIEQQIAVILKEVYGFRVADIVEILNSSEGKVKHALADARKTMIDIFDRRCTLVSKTGPCWECSEINGFVNPKAETRAQDVALTEAAERGASREELFELRAELIRGVDPLNAPGAALHAYLLTLMPEQADSPPDE